jgi:hypothetical protein
MRARSPEFVPTRQIHSRLALRRLVDPMNI